MLNSVHIDIHVHICHTYDIVASIHKSPMELPTRQQFEKHMPHVAVQGRAVVLLSFSAGRCTHYQELKKQCRQQGSADSVAGPLCFHASTAWVRICVVESDGIVALRVPGR